VYPEERGQFAFNVVLNVPRADDGNVSKKKKTPFPLNLLYELRHRGGELTDN